MAVGDTITAARYNITIRIAVVQEKEQVTKVMDKQLQAQTVSVGATVTAQDMANLFVDINKCRVPNR